MYNCHADESIRKRRSCFVSVSVRLALRYGVERRLEDFLQGFGVLESDTETDQVGFDSKGCSPRQLRIVCQQCVGRTVESGQQNRDGNMDNHGLPQCEVRSQ